jgi:hypothetical protein
MATVGSIEEIREAGAALRDAAKAMADMAVSFKDLRQAEKHDPATTVANWAQPHGINGLLSDGTVRPRMYSTIPGLVDEVTNSIPLVASKTDNEIYEVMTGVTQTQGNAAADSCSEGPTPGRLKACRQVIPWGEVKVDTEVQRLTNQGRRRDYADLDRDVVNLMIETNQYIPDFVTRNVNTALGKAAIEMALGLTLGYARVDFVGVAGATSNTAYLNQFIRQYQGFETWVRTGYTDSVTTQACAGTDSVVITHNAPIGSNGTNGVSFTENVVDAYYSVTQTASEVGMGDTTFEIWVNRKAWRAIAYQWACAYYTDRCSNGAVGIPQVQDATAITQARDEMLRNRVLLIDGVAVPVRVTDGIQAIGMANNNYQSDLFVMPRAWRGNPLIYREFFPLNNADAQEFVANSPEARIINNGLYAVGRRTTNGFCTKWEFYSKNRLILDAPFLAARVNDFSFNYRAQDRDAFVGESLYRDGGVSGRLATTST